jgi:DNA-binding protein HU-beta
MVKAPKKSATPMTKAQLVSHLAESVGAQKKLVAQILEELAATAYKEAKKGFTVPGFGKLVLVKRKARMGRNPQTGDPVKIPAKTVVKFRVAKACKDAILGAKK